MKISNQMKNLPKFFVIDVSPRCAHCDDLPTYARLESIMPVEMDVDAYDLKYAKARPIDDPEHRGQAKACRVGAFYCTPCFETEYGELLAAIDVED